MQLTILGSAAAEAWPALFCDCEVCHEARRRGGRDLRRRTSYRLGEHIAVDWGPDALAAHQALGLDMSTLTDLVVTHSHQDHLTPHELWYRRPGFSRVAPGVLTVSGSAAVLEAISELTTPDNAFSMATQLMEPCGEYRLADGVTVTTLPAQHAGDDGQSLNFVFHVGGRQLLIGHDTGWWPAEVWEFLRGFSLDVAIMDCTSGGKSCRGGHLGAGEVVEVKREFETLGCLAEGARVIANHFSHNGGWLYDDLVSYFEPHGIEVGFDGMVVEI